MIETEARPYTRPAEAEPTTLIRPSQAIRLGCLIAPEKTLAKHIAIDRYGQIAGACATGALALGYGWRPVSVECPYIGYFTVIDDHLPKVLPMPVDDLQTFGEEGDVSAARVIQRLNDIYGWRREDIADWLEYEHGL